MKKDNINMQENVEEKIEEIKPIVLQDFITYAKYKAIRNKYGKIIDLLFVFANKRMQSYIGADPTGKSRSLFLPMHDKMLKYALTTIDIGVAKHFSYQSKVNHFELIEGIIEPDLANLDYIHVYTVDIHLLKQNNNEQNIRNNVSTILSMFNITLLHWNSKENYIYADSILTTDFQKDNPNLYVGNTIRSSKTLYKITTKKQQEEIEKMVLDLLNGKCSFLSFNVIVKNSIGENVLVKVNVIPEELENMYMIGIQY